ncbi:MAG TPA: DNA polymerase III subunit delta' [Aliiroseovarius sp.]|nr:DNA polymerase III subunit delta' [Aliiroseovarius sp.]
MSEPDERPEPDRIDGAPHPRMAPRVIGQDAAQAAFLDAFNADRMHHGWLIAGPHGVGKATLAWTIARFLRAHPPATDALFAPPPATSLDLPEGHPVVAQVRALSEPGIFLLRRGWNDKVKPGRLYADITVDEVRKLRSFFALTLPDGGRRVVIVDAADEMNPNAANALLKLLEEPPAGAVLLLVAHQPMRLLPTIRSRCRELRLGPLAPDALAAVLDQTGTEAEASDALLELAQGSAGEALALAGQDGPALYARLVALLAHAPRYDRQAAMGLAAEAAGRGHEQRFALIVRLIRTLLARLARHGAGMTPEREAAPGEAALLARLAPGPASARAWAALEQDLSARAGHAVAVNLDPAALILDMIFRINETAAQEAA